jgi:hypothetical protein
VESNSVRLAAGGGCLDPWLEADRQLDELRRQFKLAATIDDPEDRLQAAQALAVQAEAIRDHLLRLTAKPNGYDPREK